MVLELCGFSRTTKFVDTTHKIMNCIFLCCSCFVTLFSFQSTCRNRMIALVGSNGLEPSTSRLSGARSNHLSYEPIQFSLRSFCSVQDGPHGGDEGIRTPDPLRARQVLSQLSYTPILSFRVSRAVPSSQEFAPFRLHPLN